MRQQTDAVAAYGERIAMRTLALAGMEILDRNWRCAEGEIDLVARDDRALVFCEVTTRRNQRFGVRTEPVRPTRVQRLRAAAVAWLAAHPRQHGEVRFDVVSVWPQRKGPPRVEHLTGTF
jgi:putative endonuclease